MTTEYKILFVGTMGSGKTTAIRAVSRGPVVSTDVANFDTAAHTKETTTVGLDYGEVQLEDGSVLRLYGTPGQERFQFMWEILARRALGVVLLVDNSRPDPLTDLLQYVESFASLIQRSAAVVGVGRTETHPEPSIDRYCDHLAERGWILPVLSVDVRRQADVLTLLDTLFAAIEMSDAEESVC
jgi:signal recognition particle receptor subunit beta